MPTGSGCSGAEGSGPGWINPAGWRRNAGMEGRREHLRVSDGSVHCSCLLPETIRTSWFFLFFFSPQPVGFSDKELQWERLDVRSFTRNEINTSNSDSSVALIKQSFCLDGDTPRRRGDGRRVLSSPEDETSKTTKPNKEREKRPFLFLLLFFCSGWLISSSVPRV